MASPAHAWRSPFLFPLPWPHESHAPSDPLCPSPRGPPQKNKNDHQGSELWRRLRTGDPTQDWPLLQQISFEDPESFWPAVLQRLRIRFHSVPSRVLARHADPDQVSWFPGARLNVAECALAGRDPDRPAVVWAEEGTPTELHTLSLGALAQRAQHVADALRAAGFQPGAAELGVGTASAPGRLPSPRRAPPRLHTPCAA